MKISYLKFPAVMLLLMWILLPDKTFSSLGLVWIENNLNVSAPLKYQEKFPLDAWADISSDQLNGPSLLRYRLIGELYLVLLKQVLSCLLTTFLSTTQTHKWLIHDGSRALFFHRCLTLLECHILQTTCFIVASIGVAFTFTRSKPIRKW